MIELYHICSQKSMIVCERSAIFLNIYERDFELILLNF